MPTSALAWSAAFDFASGPNKCVRWAKPSRCRCMLDVGAPVQRPRKSLRDVRFIKVKRVYSDPYAGPIIYVDRRPTQSGIRD